MPKKKKTLVAEKPEILVFVACDAISRDPNSNKSSLYGLIDTILADSLPTQLGHFSLYAKIRGTGKHDVQLNFSDPSGEAQKIGGPLSISFGRGNTCEIQIDVNGFAAKRQGDHQFYLTVGRKRLQPSLTISVKRQKKK